MTQLRAVDRNRVSASVVDRIQVAIRAGELDPGSPMPSERLLSEQLAVSRSSLREAIRILEHAGVLEVRPGAGTFVTPDAMSRATTMRAQAALVGQESPIDVMVVRRALDPLCAGQAALHRRTGDLHLLRERFERHASLVEGSVEDVSEANLAFHLALTSATHNPVLILLQERLTQVMQDGTWHVIRFRPENERRTMTAKYVSEHAAILDAVERQDETTACRAVHAHLDSVEAAIFSAA